MPLGFVQGLPAVGLAPPYGIFPQQPALPITLEDVFFDCEAHNSEIKASLKPGLHDDFLLSQCVADAEAGLCTPPLTWSQLLRATQGKPIRLIPRCVIQQSLGKQRIIDNAHAGGQSAFSSESNKLVLCSALRPAQHAALAISAFGFDRAKEVLQHDSLEGGGEDWPNAYRSHVCRRVVCWHHQEWEAPAYQLYTGLLFGLPFTSFNRYSRFSEALGRRLLFLLVSLYFDDAHLTDWSSSKGSGQQAFRDLNEIMGSPFAEDKRQDMAPTGTFLGLDFDLGGISADGAVCSCLLGSVAASRESRGHASHSGTRWGVAPRSGVQALWCTELPRARHVRPSGDWWTTGAEGAADREGGGAHQRPSTVHGGHPSCAGVVAASDAAEDVLGEGAGGFLLVWRSGLPSWEAFVAEVSPSVYSIFTPGDHKIAQLELSMVLYALTARRSRFRGARGVWYIDNVAALICLISWTQ